jgi:membrane carboxypeptidase/penicillin-binding protein PbpC
MLDFGFWMLGLLKSFMRSLFPANYLRHFVYFFLLPFLGLFLLFHWYSTRVTSELEAIYNERQSKTIVDREGEVVAILFNQDGYYADYLDRVPDRFNKLLLQKEDQQFYRHPGINPLTTIRAGYYKLTTGENYPSSTLTQQLVKILRSQEADRSIANKLSEIIEALALDYQLDKQEILTSYTNSVYLGNQVQGLRLASRLYFDLEPKNLTPQQIIRLLPALSAPTRHNPFIDLNVSQAEQLARNLDLEFANLAVFTQATIDSQRAKFAKLMRRDSYFEMASLYRDQAIPKGITIDNQLTDKIREIVQSHLAVLQDSKATHSAVVVIKLPENELLAMVGSPEPTSLSEGNQINMALSPRPIGSTIKPFIYARGFEEGLRGYSLVDDREYRYETGEGFPFYPRNYDYEYNGIVSLHYALANSLNIPTVKVLEYVGIEEFNAFLTEKLDLEPVQEIENYELSIALGGLETDILNLAHFFTVFGQEGLLKNLKVSQSDYSKTTKTIFAPEIVALTNKILSDRETGASQFGLVSNLNLPQGQFAVKTGTSREYHDSWTVGYTPDFLVAVWVGNVENEPMDEISGSKGAGRIWQDTMNLLLNSQYHHNSRFDFRSLETFVNADTLEYGLRGDDYEYSKNLMLADKLILSPHNNDIFLYEYLTNIFLRSNKSVSWSVNGQFIERGSEVNYLIPSPGNYLIRAESEDGVSEEVEVVVNAP